MIGVNMNRDWPERVNPCGRHCWGLHAWGSAAAMSGGLGCPVVYCYCLNSHGFHVLLHQACNAGLAACVHVLLAWLQKGVHPSGM